VAYYISTSEHAVRFDTPTYVLFVSTDPNFATQAGLVAIFNAPGSGTGIVLVYVSASSGIQSKDIQPTDDPATFPGHLAVLYLDEVGRIQKIVDWTTGTAIPRP
jgi:hypothetical protein